MNIIIYCSYSEVTHSSGSQAQTIVVRNVKLPLCIINEDLFVCFFQNTGSGSGFAAENAYAELAQPPEKTPEEQPLLEHGTRTSPTADNGAGDPGEHPPPLPPRLMTDDASTPPVSDQGTSASPHQVTGNNGAGGPTYAPVLATKPNAVAPPPESEMIPYEDIQWFQNQQVDIY